MNERESIAREVEELTARCKQTCDLYKHVSADLGAWMSEQRSIVNQHEDLLIRSSLDFRVLFHTPNTFIRWDSKRFAAL